MNPNIEHIICPSTTDSNPSHRVFIGGGISGCPDWQSEFVGKFTEFSSTDKTVSLYNPRRVNFDVNDTNILEEQINWENKFLSSADIIIFWFPKETLCPITLFELGKYLVSNKKLLIGVHPEYQRRKDLHFQVGLVRSEVVIVDSIPELVNQLIEQTE